MPKRSLLNKSIDVMLYTKNKKVPLIPQIIQKFIRVTFSCDIPSTVLIGKGTYFSHNGLGVVIHAKATIGENCNIYQNVTIGGRNNRGCPTIENNVFIGAGACILGGIVIGENAVIGANSVVLKDVPPNAVVVGVPGKIVKYKKEK